MQTIFPKWSTPILESVSSIGLLFFLFLVGLELDLSSIRRGGQKAFTIAVAGVSFPFILGVGVAFIFRKAIDGADKVGFAQYTVFMGVSLSITAFPVLARILAELKLFTTRVGETAMAAAAFNDIAAWILLALAIALAADGSSEHKNPMVALWVLLSGAAFVVLMMVVVKPVMAWINRRCLHEPNAVDEAYICLTLAGVMVAGFVTDFIGVHAIFGAFVFGLTIPKEGQFAERLIERIEDFVSGLLLPLYFASSGLKTDVTKIQGGMAWGLLVLVISTACTGKIFGTFTTAILWKIPVRESLALGCLMNTKGLVELIVLNIGKEKKVLNDEAFAILVLMALFTTFVTTPAVLAIYKPARSSMLSKRKLESNTHDDDHHYRIMACIHGPNNIPSLVSLIETIRPTNPKSKLKLYVMQLVGLTERSSSIATLQRLKGNGFKFINRLRRKEYELVNGIAMAFQGYSQLGRVAVSPTAAISPLTTMHEDILELAENKSVRMIIVPFHKQYRRKTDGGIGPEFQVENVGHGWWEVHQRLIQVAPCSVAVLVDRGFGWKSEEEAAPPSSTSGVVKRVSVIFFGGPDDREALAFGGRMAEHPAVKVTVIRFTAESHGSGDQHAIIPMQINEKELDDAAVHDFRMRWEGKVEFKEMTKVSNTVESVLLGIGRNSNEQCYDLVIVGKGRRTSLNVGTTEEYPELGPVGDLLASSNQGIVCSALVIQHHGNMAHSGTQHFPAKFV
ncbi:OLC1v1034805C1 [Oldenlandia corymbosa var. corymbosa]|nr:OLC1v1034805C1 [Oldenlandia corymbosa var. corymbosa]